MKIRVRLDWLIDVRGIDDEDEDEAVGIVYDYIKEQDLVEATDFETPDESDDDVTMTLYPEGFIVPADEDGPWSTYTRREAPVG